MKAVRRTIAPLAFLGVVACGMAEPSAPETRSEAGVPRPGEIGSDLGAQDLGALDSGPEQPETGPNDLAVRDAGPDTGAWLDAGVTDLGPPDAGRPDFGSHDLGQTDSGVTYQVIVDHNELARLEMETQEGVSILLANPPAGVTPFVAPAGARILFDMPPTMGGPTPRYLAEMAVRPSTAGSCHLGSHPSCSVSSVQEDLYFRGRWAYEAPDAGLTDVGSPDGGGSGAGYCPVPSHQPPEGTYFGRQMSATCSAFAPGCSESCSWSSPVAASLTVEPSSIETAFSGAFASLREIRRSQMGSIVTITYEGSSDCMSGGGSALLNGLLTIDLATQTATLTAACRETNPGGCNPGWAERIWATGRFRCNEGGMRCAQGSIESCDRACYCLPQQSCGAPCAPSAPADAGSIPDAGSILDGGSISDAGSTSDAGSPHDAGLVADASTPDVSALDAGALDLSTVDIGMADLGSGLDAGTADAAFPAQRVFSVTATGSVVGDAALSGTAEVVALGDSRIATVHVHRRGRSGWRWTASIRPSHPDGADCFGCSVALSDDGSVLVVGAPNEDGASNGVGGDPSDNTLSNSGAVFVFRRSGGMWTQEAYIKASTSDSYDYFGDPVAVSGDGDRIFVGGTFEDSAATGINAGGQADNAADAAGAVYVFRRASGTWIQEAYIKASNTDPRDFFGSAIAVDRAGRRLAVGARGEGSAASGVGGDQSSNALVSPGAVYLFSRTATTWAQEAYIKASNTRSGFGFGVSVSLSRAGDVLAVGAPGEDGVSRGVGGSQASSPYTGGSGAAYVFRRSGGTWRQEAYLKASNADPEDGFGLAVAVAGAGDILGVGADGEASDATTIDGDQHNNHVRSAGAAYLFWRTSTGWRQVAYLKDPASAQGTQFGRGLAADPTGAWLLSAGVWSLATGITWHGHQLAPAGSVSPPDAGVADGGAVDAGSYRVTVIGPGALHTAPPTAAVGSCTGTGPSCSIDVPPGTRVIMGNAIPLSCWESHVDMLCGPQGLRCKGSNPPYRGEAFCWLTPDRDTVLTYEARYVGSDPGCTAPHRPCTASLECGPHGTISCGSCPTGEACGASGWSSECVPYTCP